jgi:hypothetical protein
MRGKTKYDWQVEKYLEGKVCGVFEWFVTAAVLKSLTVCLEDDKRQIPQNMRRPTMSSPKNSYEK